MTDGGPPSDDTETLPIGAGLRKTSSTSTIFKLEDKTKRNVTRGVDGVLVSVHRIRDDTTTAAPNSSRVENPVMT